LVGRNFCPRPISNGMQGLLNKTFLKFLVRFVAIILIGVTGAFIAGIVDTLRNNDVASVNIGE